MVPTTPMTMNRYAWSRNAFKAGGLKVAMVASFHKGWARTPGKNISDVEERRREKHLFHALVLALHHDEPDDHARTPAP